MIREIEQKGITIRLDLNQDESVNMKFMMEITYQNQHGRLVNKKIYPDNYSFKNKSGDNIRCNYGTIQDQFELVKSIIRFDKACEI